MLTQANPDPWYNLIMISCSQFAHSNIINKNSVFAVVYRDFNNILKLIVHIQPSLRLFAAQSTIKISKLYGPNVMPGFNENNF